MGLVYAGLCGPDALGDLQCFPERTTQHNLTWRGRSDTYTPRVCVLYGPYHTSTEPHTFANIETHHQKQHPDDTHLEYI